jgi:hypothetical protein
MTRPLDNVRGTARHGTASDEQLSDLEGIKQKEDFGSLY